MPRISAQGSGRMSDTTTGIEERVRERAYLLWEREGRPEGRAEEHWRRAAELEAAEAAPENQGGRRTEAREADDGSHASITPPRTGRAAAKRRAPIRAPVYAAGSGPVMPCAARVASLPNRRVAGPAAP